MEKRKCVLYIATSVDGLISGPNDDLSFLDKMGEEDDYGYSDFLKTVDTMVVGRRTYDWVQEKVGHFPTHDLDTFVITGKEISVDQIKVYSGSPTDLVKELKKQEGRDIFCNGGATVVNDLLKGKQIDEIILAVVPHLLGRGVPLFSFDRPETEMELVESKAHESGLVQNRYKVLGFEKGR